MTMWRVHTATLFYSLLTSLSEIDLFLDVGSLDGREAFSVEARFPGIKCIAFEPNPRNSTLLQQEIVQRGSQVAIETTAVGNENGTASFYTRSPLASRNYGASSLLAFASPSRNEEFATTVIEVPLRRLDSIQAIEAYRKIALWIDVEGAGYSVIEGLTDVAQKVQLLHIEVETQQLFDRGKLAHDVIHAMSLYGLELVGSNLDKSLCRHQGDMVFLRKQALDKVVLQRALQRAAFVERLGLQKMALKMLPPKLYRGGRKVLVHLVTSR